MRMLSAAGLSNSDIGVILGVTPNAVKVALYKARKRRARNG